VRRSLRLRRRFSIGAQCGVRCPGVGLEEEACPGEEG